MSLHESQNCEITCFHIGGVVGDPVLLGCEPVLMFTSISKEHHLLRS